MGTRRVAKEVLAPSFPGEAVFLVSFLRAPGFSLGVCWWLDGAAAVQLVLIPAGRWLSPQAGHLPPSGGFSWVAGDLGSSSLCPELHGPRKGSRLLSPLKGGTGGREERKEVLVSYDLSIKVVLAHRKGRSVGIQEDF